MSFYNRRFRIEFAVFFVLLGILLGAGLRLPEVVAKKLNAYEFFDPLVDLRDKITRFYVEQPDEQKMLDGALSGMIATLDDPYTNYFTPKQLASFEKSTTGTFSGIGAEIEVRDMQLRIVTPLEDSPAFKAGILAGDAILEVNGESSEGLSVEEAVQKITGPEGTDVNLKVRHPDGEEVVITITRRKIEIETVRGFRRDADGHWDFMLDPQSQIGYIRLAQFSSPTYEALVEALDKLQKQKMRGLIIDLRYNPGGLLDSAIRVSDLFLKDGVIVSTKGRNGENERIVEANASGTLPDFPLVVLVNEFSASASEIVSGALRDNGRAIILGTRTVGKGSVQELMPLDGEAGAVKLTTRYYYLPSGRNIHRRDDAELWGVDPTDGYYVSMDAKEREAMAKVRREGDIIKPTNGDDEDGHKMNSEWITENLKDLQLAAAFKTILAKLNDGEFAKVGKDNASLLARLNEREDKQRLIGVLSNRIDELKKDIEKIDESVTVPEDEDASSDAGAEPAEGDAAKPAEAPELQEAAP